MMTEAVLLWALGSTGSPSAPYPTTKIECSLMSVQSLECTNTIGLLRIGSLANNQGIVRCTTTITSGLDRYVNYFAVYNESVFNNYSE